MLKHSLYALVLAVAATYCVQAHAEDITGDYTVEGSDTDGGNAYTGTCSIQKKGEVFTMVWQIENKKEIGSGIITDNVLSACFKDADTIGLCSYKISAGKLTGLWAELKTDGKVYKETLTKK